MVLNSYYRTKKGKEEIAFSDRHELVLEMIIDENQERLFEIY